MQLRIVAQNLQCGGLRNEDGATDDRWPLLAKRINAAWPDILLLNEVVGWDDRGHHQAGRAMADLDLDLVPLPSSRSGFRSAIMYRPETVGRWRRTSHDTAGRTSHGFVAAAFRISGLPVPLTVLAAHLDPVSGDQALIESAAIATHAYRYGPLAIIGGDMNCAPEAGPEPDYTQMRPYNIAAQTLLTDPADPTAARRPDRRAAWQLRQAGYLDAAWHRYQASGDKALLRRTAHADRIDRFLLAERLGRALRDYETLDTHPDASDHKGIAITVDTDAIDRSNLWTYR